MGPYDAGIFLYRKSGVLVYKFCHSLGQRNAAVIDSFRSPEELSVISKAEIIRSMLR
jgi:hypothetical protein